MASSQTFAYCKAPVSCTRTAKRARRPDSPKKTSLKKTAPKKTGSKTMANAEDISKKAEERAARAARLEALEEAMRRLEEMMEDVGGEDGGDDEDVGGGCPDGEDQGGRRPVRSEDLAAANSLHLFSPSYPYICPTCPSIESISNKLVSKL